MMPQTQLMLGSGRRAPSSVPPENGPLADAVLHVIERINQVLREEQTLVTRLDFTGIETLIARKSHLALELSRLLEHAQGLLHSEAVRTSVEQLRGDLAENAKLLRRHMDAVCEISSLIAEAIQCSSADGTYSRQAARSGQKPWSR